MRVLVVDTATAVTTVALLAGGDHDGDSGPDTVLAAAVHDDPRGAGERLAVLVADVCAATPGARADAVVVGVGPGPYTSLRVGVMTGLALAAAWRCPVLGAMSLDGLVAPPPPTHQPPPTPPPPRAAAAVHTVALTDARRREVFAAAYTVAGVRVGDPRVLAPAAVAALLGPGGEWSGAGLVGPGAALPGVVWPAGTRVDAARSVDPQWLAARVWPDVAAGVRGAATGATAAPPPRPWYLRRPDATEPAVAVPS